MAEVAIPQAKVTDKVSVAGSVCSQDSSGLKAVRLPKLELPKFSGNVAEWQTFWDKFTAIVDESDIPVVSKFTYLQSLLDGEAKACIQGLSITSSHYKLACELLKERFGRKDRIIFSHIQALLNLSVVTPRQGNKVASLWKLQDELQAHVRSLEDLDIDGTTYGVFLTPVILSRLPQDIRMEWAREGEGKESDLNWLLQFLRKEIERRERSETFKETSTYKPVAEEKRVRMPSASALHATTGHASCAFCGKLHQTERCWDISKLTVPDRKEKIRQVGLCFRCLQKGHIARGCSAKCATCNGRHHQLCCFGTNMNSVPRDNNMNSVSRDNNSETPVSVDGRSESVANVLQVGAVCSQPMNNKRNRTVLQTARVCIEGARGNDVVTLMFDSGSDKSYITHDLVNKVGPKWVGKQGISYAAFGTGKSTKQNLRNVYHLKLKDREGRYQFLEAVEVPVICPPLHRPPLPENLMKSLAGMDLADSYGEDRQVHIDILVGLDFYWQLVKPQTTPLSECLVTQNTVFGQVVSGSWGNGNQPHSSSVQLLCLNDVPDAVLQGFWDLESLGISPRETEQSGGIDPVLDSFNKTLKFRDGRYEVSLPWKQEFGSPACRLMNNENIARARLCGLSRRLDRDPELKVRYNEALKEIEDLGIGQEVPEEMSGNPIFYLPHHPVVREASLTTKVRPVFDASAPGLNGVSLNDCLEAGPSLIPNLVGILIRFRRWKVALSADITKAFLQIGVCKKDQDVHRFLWEHEGTIRVMRFLRVPFGNKSSPFLLNATLQHLLASCPSTAVIEELKENLYVDDWLTGADSDHEACQMFEEAREVMSRANMTLAKWNSNSKTVSDIVYQTFEEKHSASTFGKILGMKWIFQTDSFSFVGIEVPAELRTTKRVVLSFIARLFDPLGFLSPFIMLAKILFQDIWSLGLAWDEEVPEAMHKLFSSWVQGTELLRKWKISRCYCAQLPWSDLSNIQLHAFGDASEKGYGASVYLRIPNGDGAYKVSLVASKAKVAPLKKVSLLRLELLGALLCARLVKFVHRALKLPDSIVYRCWTDSMVVLGWIKSDPHKWKTFVANRVSEIQILTAPCCWYHCPGRENPADPITRGLFADDLVSSTLWLEGPVFLSENNDQFNDSCVSEFCTDLVTEDLSSLASLDQTPEVCFEIERWGCFNKAQRIMGWVLRFIENTSCKGSHRYSGELLCEELSAARVKLFRYE